MILHDIYYKSYVGEVGGDDTREQTLREREKAQHHANLKRVNLTSDGILISKFP